MSFPALQVLCLWFLEKTPPTKLLSFVPLPLSRSCCHSNLCKGLIIRWKYCVTTVYYYFCNSVMTFVSIVLNKRGMWCQHVCCVIPVLQSSGFVDLFWSWSWFGIWKNSYPPALSGVYEFMSIQEMTESNRAGLFPSSNWCVATVQKGGRYQTIAVYTTLSDPRERRAGKSTRKVCEFSHYAFKV